MDKNFIDAFVTDTMNYINEENAELSRMVSKLNKRNNELEIQIVQFSQINKPFLYPTKAIWTITHEKLDNEFERTKINL